MLRLYPTDRPAALDDTAALVGAYAYPELTEDGQWVRANMVTSLDGAAQGPNGRSGSLSSPADKRVFALLRALADVIVAGAGTVRTERYGPAEPEFSALRRRSGQPERPPIAVVSRSLDLDPAASLFVDADPRTIVLTVEASPPDRRAALEGVADVIVAGQRNLDVPAALDALAARGLRRVLCEGGPHLLGHVIAADALDELCYTITPTIVGGAADRLVATSASLTSRWTLGHVLEEDGTLLTRWLRRSSSTHERG